MTPTIYNTGNWAITAAEGGIGYWSVIVSEYDPDRWLDSTGDEPLDDLPVNFAYYTIEDDDGERFVITPELLRRGFRLAMQPDANIADWALRDQFDERDPDSLDYIDSIAADAIVQFGCYGRLVYG